jgi:hypothetical protein
MSERGIEKSLRDITQPPFHAKYTVLKDRLLNYEYEHWAASFPHGNNHGPGHINRVLDKLDELLGDRILEERVITAYELFLSMMAILYHDVGILRERKGHGDISANFLDLDDNAYIFDQRDKQIIRAAVVSHSSSKDIEVECSAFSAVEYIGRQSARPRVVAALVRLSDELDEDFRRADPRVAAHIGIADSSQFFWAFSQRIHAIRPDRQRREIYIGVQFEPNDADWTVSLDGKPRLFISAFAEKLAKINHERVYVGLFLPDELRCHFRGLRTGRVRAISFSTIEPVLANSPGRFRSCPFGLSILSWEPRLTTFGPGGSMTQRLLCSGWRILPTTCRRRYAFAPSG